MYKNKIFIKKLKKLLLSTNLQIESFFNYFKNFKYIKKKKILKINKIDKRIFISIGIIVFLALSYFLTPAFYNENLVKIHFKNQILKKYNLEVKFDQKFKYSFFPKPHYYTKGINFIYDKRNVAKSDFVKINISVKNFFSLNNIRIKNIFFKKTEFNINIKNYTFFEKILSSVQRDEKINFIKSKLFYKDQNNDVIFFSNISNINFSLNENQAQELKANLKIYNIPFSLNIINNIIEKKSYAKIDSHKLRLSIINNFDYEYAEIDGLLELKYISKTKKINYVINKNSLNFITNKENVKGRIDFKPFYLRSDIKINKLDIKKIFKSNSVFVNLLNSEILNNQNLNAQINIFADSIKDYNNLNNINLKTYFEQGDILIKDSTVYWKNSVIIKLDTIQLINQNNKLIVTGSITFNFTDLNDFYRQYQIKKTDRKKIEKISLDFLMNLYEQNVEIDNLKVDGILSKTTNNFLNDYNEDKKDIFKKVVFKNLVKEFFRNL